MHDSSKRHPVVGGGHPALQPRHLWNSLATLRLAAASCAGRQVALRRGQGDLPAAIEALRAYLDVQQSDWVAWEELADLYLQIQVRG